MSGRWSKLQRNPDGSLYVRDEALERFERFVDKGEGSDDCWIWLSTLNRGSYGLFSLNGQQIRAYWFSLELVGVRLKLGDEVLHECDVPLCVRPDHLKVGSHAQNLALARLRPGGMHGNPLVRSKIQRAHERREAVRQQRGLDRKPTLEELFWAKVDKTTDHPQGCWIWTGAAEKDDRPGCGHGTFWTGKRVEGAHRIAYSLCIGPVPPNLDVCHRCDNPRCVRAECNVVGCKHGRADEGCESHLWLGTPADNTRDMILKGRDRRSRGQANGMHTHPESRAYGDKNWTRRHPERVRRGDEHHARLHPERVARGERARHAKLTADHVVQIREHVQSGVTTRELAERYGVSIGTIERVITGDTWAHIGGPTAPKKQRDKLNAVSVAAIRAEAAAGRRQQDIADEHGVARSLISVIIHRKIWRHVD